MMYKIYNIGEARWFHTMVAFFRGTAILGSTWRILTALTMHHQHCTKADA